VSYSAGATSEFRLAAPGSQPVAALVPAVMMVVLGLATAVAALLTNDVSGAVATLLMGGLLMAAWVAPLRVPLLVVMFVGLAVDRPGDAEGRWASPLITVGGLLFQNLNKVVGVEALKFSGVFLLLTCLLMVRGYRVLGGQVRDTQDSLRPAAPVVWGVVIAVLSIAFNVLAGWLRGGDIQMAKVQVQAFLQLLAVAYLFGVSLRGPRDYRLAGKVIVAAACIKACMAVWIRLTLPAAYPNRYGGMTEMEYATSHGDSLLFACAIAVLIAPLMSPVILAYVLAGWSLPSRVFGPVHFVRNLVVDTRPDGSLDRSTLYRDAENYNLVYTFRSNPVIGSGFGQPFAQTAALDDISGGFREFAYLPHNSMLGLWAFTGAVGFTGILAPLVIALFLAARAHACASEPVHAIAATVSIACIGAYVLHLWGDIGFTEGHTIFLIGLAVAVAAQIATATGAWPVRWRRRSIGDAE
jgi:hypothetical protein